MTTELRLLLRHNRFLAMLVSALGIAAKYLRRAREARSEPAPFIAAVSPIFAWRL